MTLSERLRSERLSNRLRSELPPHELLRSLQVCEPDGDDVLPHFVGFPAEGLKGEVCFS